MPFNVCKRYVDISRPCRLIVEIKSKLESEPVLRHEARLEAMSIQDPNDIEKSHVENSA